MSYFFKVAQELDNRVTKKTLAMAEAAYKEPEPLHSLDMDPELPLHRAEPAHADPRPILERPC